MQVIVVLFYVFCLDVGKG